MPFWIARHEHLTRNYDEDKHHLSRRRVATGRGSSPQMTDEKNHPGPVGVLSVQSRRLSILDQDFQKNVAKRRRTKTKAAEIEHAIRHYLDIDLDDDPDLQASFAKALAQIFQDFRDNWEKIHEELEKLRRRIISASQETTYGLHRKKQMPFFRMFRRELFGVDTEVLMVAETSPHYGLSEDDKISHLVALTQSVSLVIERELKLTGFWESIPARNRLKAEIQKALLQPRFLALPNLVRKRNQIISRAMEIAKKNNDIILYAK